jgi:ATP-dependent DNA helicase Rep
MIRLNQPQSAAVSYMDGPLLVLAGAGSGKTRVITEKIAHLIKQQLYPADKICAVTFTNKAAREMRQRVAAKLGKRAGKGPRISTFHTLGLDIIRREYGGLGLRQGFSIMDSADTLGVLKDVLKKSGPDAVAAAESTQWKISSWKNAMLSPEQAAAQAQDPLERAAAHAYGLYSRALKAYNAVDFDDLILLPVQFFDKVPERVAEWRDRLGYLLVDEYQDTNLAQYHLLKRLIGDQGAITVVGDDDQSIYAWRGAAPENLKQLASDYPGLRVIKLEQNYRSTVRILRVANQLISNNPHLFEKKLWSGLGEGEVIRVLRARDAADEAQRVVGEIVQAQRLGKGPLNEIAILYRSNYLARPFEQALRGQGVPYVLSGGTSFFDRTEVKDILAYLRLMANPTDDRAFLRIVNVPRREIGTRTLEGLAAHAGARHRSLLESAGDMGLAARISERGARRLKQFTELVSRLAETAERKGPITAVKDLMLEIDYEGWLVGQAKDPVAAQRASENVQDLLRWLEKMVSSGEDRDLPGLLARISLLDRLSGEDDDASDGVRLMTLHSAKGLEFNNVFLVAVEEEQLPHKNSTDPKSLEEERRLMYVGITRARQRLTVSYCAQRKRYGDALECMPSRFLEELPQEDLRWEGRKEDLTPEERRERGRAAIANLRGLLADG